MSPSESVFTDLKGVYASGTYAGIKSKSSDDDAILDLGYIYVPDAVSSAGVFTKNQSRASSVDYTQLHKNQLKAMIVNSGNANALTGELGTQHTFEMAHETAHVFGLDDTQVGVASTGITGEPLAIDRITHAIPKLCDPSLKQGQKFADSILTTDLKSKQTWKSHTFEDGSTWVVAGCTKGSGMIAPNMATTLGFLICNVKIPADVHQNILEEAIDDSYNMLSVDTDSSTNDMMISFATGEHELTHPLSILSLLYKEACIDLAKQIAEDGEGASHAIEVTVRAAETERLARKVAKSVVDSPLVKTAIAGEDPNWGRILVAIGKTDGLSLDLEQLSVKIQDQTLFQEGETQSFNRDELSKKMNQKWVHIEIDLGAGPGMATAYGCDLTHGYITINTAYN